MKKIIINTCYGGFGISKKAEKRFGCKEQSYEEIRTNSAIIEAIETEGAKAISDRYAELAVVTIPDEATDYQILEEDGKETLICVINGKIYTVYSDGEIIAGI